MRILVVGAGAIGGYFGGRLAAAGTNVTFLVRERRAAQLVQHGLIIESPLGDLRHVVETVQSTGNLEPPDIILIACKAYALRSVLDDIAPCINPDMAILPLLNGFAHLEAIEQRFPTTSVWGGLAHIGVTLDTDGTVKHLNRIHNFIFGLRGDHANDEASRHRALSLYRAIVSAGINARLSEAIEQEMWEKFIFLGTLAASTCLMRASIGAILETPGGEDFILRLLDEATAIANAEGYVPNADTLAAYRSQLTEIGSPSTASMLRDVERGAPTEAEHILGDMVKRAQKHGIAAPGIAMALMHLRTYEVRHPETHMSTKPTNS